MLCFSNDFKDLQNNDNRNKSESELFLKLKVNREF